jgi:hypothetical protein
METSGTRSESPRPPPIAAITANTSACCGSFVDFAPRQLDLTDRRALAPAVRAVGEAHARRTMG